VRSPSGYGEKELIVIGHVNGILKIKYCENEQGRIDA